MINSDFRLLCESLGFYSSKHIVDYVKHFTGEQISIRLVDYWLKGKESQVYSIRPDIEQTLLNLQQKQMHIVKREREKLAAGETISFKHVFKDPVKMWVIYPEMQGLPVSFLNQILIRLGVSFDYYENEVKCEQQ